MKRIHAMLLGLTVVLFAQIPTAMAQANDTCIKGYVWREAFPGDHVCVTPATRKQTAQDNWAAKKRVQRGGGAYGPETCIQGYVWREARQSDHVCVTPETRAQAREDNRLAKLRIARSPSRSPVEPAGDRRAMADARGNTGVVSVVDIDCPVKQVRAEITTNLPAQWWQTPQVGSLVNTSVRNIGGKMTLVCSYRAYGNSVSVMREMPANMHSCSPVTGGFRCR